MKKKFYYRLSILPPEISDHGRDWGILAHLDGDIARMALNTRLTEEDHERFQRLGRSIVVNSGLATESQLVQDPYFFWVDNGNLTLLLQYCALPGDAPRLSVLPRDIKELKERSVLERYNSVNVDNPLQAYTFASLWTNWANHLEVISEK